MELNNDFFWALLSVEKFRFFFQELFGFEETPLIRRDGRKEGHLGIRERRLSLIPVHLIVVQLPSTNPLFMSKRINLGKLLKL